jgi:endoglucanase
MALGTALVCGSRRSCPMTRPATRHLRTRQFADRPPPGALAGGANSRDTSGWPTDPRLVGRPPQCCYLDEPTSETTNDVCIRWNAPLAYISAALA